jgi:heme/copper-type cytochrome/quinol oxidase subunit 4
MESALLGIGIIFLFSFGYLKKNPVLLIFSSLSTLALLFSFNPMPSYFIAIILIAFAVYQIFLCITYFLEMK